MLLLNDLDSEIMDNLFQKSVNLFYHLLIETDESKRQTRAVGSAYWTPVRPFRKRDGELWAQHYLISYPWNHFVPFRKYYKCHLRPGVMHAPVPRSRPKVRSEGRAFQSIKWPVLNFEFGLDLFQFFPLGCSVIFHSFMSSIDFHLRARCCQGGNYPLLVASCIASSHLRSHTQQM